jgi:hypothetical protein
LAAKRLAESSPGAGSELSERCKDAGLLDDVADARRFFSSAAAAGRKSAKPMAPQA